MIKWQADWVYPVSGPPLRKGILIADSDGLILDVLRDQELDDVLYMPGVLVPGFVNAHGHLELSWLHQKISPGHGLSAFIRELQRERQIIQDTEKWEEMAVGAMLVAEQEMWQNGIAVCGDISNSALSIQAKIKSTIKYHTFIELFEPRSVFARARLDEGLALKQKFEAAGLRASLSPHAPYSLSSELFQLLAHEASEAREPISIHHLESAEERIFIETGTGPMSQLFSGIPLKSLHFHGIKGNITASLLERIDPEVPLLLVHNTAMVPEDIFMVMNMPGNVNFCLCPRANMYIEKKWPPIGLIKKTGKPICLGTDSLASNEHLSILEEMVLIHEKHPGLPLQTLLEWACINGARFLKMDDLFGSFEPNKKPGIVLLEGIDAENPQLHQKVTARRLK